MRDFQALLVGAHHLLDGPIVVVRDNLGRHTCARMRAFIERHEWLTVYQLPSYAPELNPAEGVWANPKGRLPNLTARSVDELTVLIRSYLKRMRPWSMIMKGWPSARPQAR